MTFWRGEAMCWWIDHGKPPRGARYHRGPMPQGPTVRIMPLVVHGTVEEATAAGYAVPCMIAACGDAEQRLTRPRGRWQRGGKVRRN